MIDTNQPTSEQKQAARTVAELTMFLSKAKDYNCNVEEINLLIQDCIDENRKLIADIRLVSRCL